MVESEWMQNICMSLTPSPSACLLLLAQCPLGARHALQQGVILLLQTSNLGRGLVKFLACGVYLLPQTDLLELSAHLAAAPFISLLAECHFFCVPFF